MRNLAHTREIQITVALLALALVFLLAPSFLFAANDAQFSSSDAQLQMTVSGTTVTLKVSGVHTVDSLTVDSGSFDVVLSQSSLVITSADRYTLTASPDSFTTSFECGASESKLALSRNLDGTATVTVTPSTTVCGGGGGGGSPSSSGGGGGGGGSAADVFTSTAVVAVAPAAVAVAPVATGASSNAELSQLINLFIALGIIPESKADAARAALSSQGVSSAAVSATFSRGIGNGAKGEDVKRLQVLLNSDPDTKVSASGAGSSGSETETFGPATESAVKKFQEKYGIAGPGSEGFGFVGPKTRAKLEEVFGSTAVPAATPATPAAPAASAAGVSASFTSALSKGSENADVMRLQKLLNSDPDTRVSSSGVGSSGSETNFFGTGTENAVKKFQTKYGIVSSGTPATTGYGAVGPATRAKLLEVFGQ